jgi:hypothetical protein
VLGLPLSVGPFTDRAAVTATVLSILALVLSLLSLGWQRGAGPRVAPCCAWNWGIESQGGGNLFQAPRLSFSAELPAHVDSHADVSFYITADAIQRHAAEHRIPYRSLRAWVQPASGKREYAKGAVPLL